MLGFRPIFSKKKFQRHGGRLWNSGQWVKEQLLYYTLFCCQSLSILLYFFSWSTWISKAACEQWQRAQWQLQLRVPMNYQNVTPHFTECTGLLMHKSLCEIEFYSEIHYIKRRFVPQSSTSQSYLHCAWNPGKHVALFRPKTIANYAYISIGIFLLILIKNSPCSRTSNREQF